MQITNLSNRNRYILAYVACLLGVSYFFPPHVRSELYKHLAMQAVVIATLALYYYYQRRHLSNDIKVKEHYKASLGTTKEAIKKKLRAKVAGEAKKVHKSPRPSNKEKSHIATQPLGSQADQPKRSE